MCISGCHFFMNIADEGVHRDKNGGLFRINEAL